jgi:hypothetical protein
MSTVVITLFCVVVGNSPLKAQLDVRAEAPGALEVLAHALVDGLDPKVMVGKLRGSNGPNLKGLRVALSVRMSNNACRLTPTARADIDQITARIAASLRARGVDAEAVDTVEWDVGSEDRPTALVSIAYPHATGENRLTSAATIQMPDGTRTNLTVVLERLDKSWLILAVGGPIILSGPIYPC